MTTITLGHATRIVDLLTHGLVQGIGIQEPGKMCVEAAVCYALGLPHSDDPGCVSPPVRRLKIRLNDALWSSNMARADGLKRLALMQLGSKGALNDVEFVRRVVDVTIRRIVPMALRAAAQVNPDHTASLEMCAVRCEQEGTGESCKEARRVARAVADAAADAASYDAAVASYDASTSAFAVSADASAFAAYDAASYDAADAAASASAAAAYTAAFAAYDAAAAASYAAYAAADAAIAVGVLGSAHTRDRVLADYAEWIVEILIDMDAPGAQWLHLAPKA